MAKTFKPENGSRQNFNSLFARLSALEAGHTRLMDRVTQLYTELFTQQETIEAIRTHENEDRAALIAQVDEGAKNICNMSASVFSNRTQDGVTVTRNDETINVLGTSGTMTNNASNIYVFGAGQYDADRTIPPGDWVAMFYGSGTGVEKLSLSVVNGNSITRGEVNAPVEFTIPSDSEHNWLRLQVAASTSYNCSIKIMICTKAAWKISKEFQPYALPNPTLTPAAIKAVDEGAKNEFDPASAWDSKTAYGVTITRNGDTYSIASGTTQSGDNNFINMGYQANTNLVPAGDWVLSFDTPQQNVRFQVCWNRTLQANASFGNNCFFTVPENTTDSWFRILLKGSTNMAGTSFKIMLCPRVFWEISQSFQPYRPSWQKLYEMILALQSGGASTQSVQPALMSAAKGEEDDTDA